jgi:hypothetical protein
VIGVRTWSSWLCRAVRRAAYVRLWPEPGTPNALAVLAVFCIPFVDLLTVYVYHCDHLPLGTLSGSVRCPIHGPSKVR